MIRLKHYVVTGALVLASAAGCNKHASSESTPKKLGEITHKDSMLATVEAVDPDARAVLLREPTGNTFAMQVGPNVPLERLQPNDTVQVAYKSTLAFALDERASKRDDGPEEERTVEENTTRELPQGVEFGRRIEAKVEVVKISGEGEAATIRAPNGELRTVVIDDAKSRRKVAALKPGDVVAVTYTEQLAVQLSETRGQL